MELLKEILIQVLRKEEINIIVPNLNISIKEIVEMECYKALQKIKLTLVNDNLSDKECFMQIEEIVCIFEGIGSDCGNRHDFS